MKTFAYPLAALVAIAPLAIPAPIFAQEAEVIDDIQAASAEVQADSPAAAAAEVGTAELAAEPAYQTEDVKLSTSMGDIVITLETERAPVTSKNFLRYVREGRFNGMSFYRASNIAEGYGLVQGGTQGNPKMVLPPIAHEPTSETGLSHTDGTISMAMGAPGTADGDFFIIVGDLVSLDATDTEPGFAAFGRVTEGMDIVRAMLAAPTDPNKGEGVMRGQFLASPVKISSAAKID